MALSGYRAKNHPQQTAAHGQDDDVDDRATHPLDFAEFNDRFGFTIDVAAAARNARCDRYYDRATDGLTQNWGGETVWCNPPYSNIPPWVRKAWEEHHRAHQIVMLLPANRTEQQWWQLMVELFRDRAGSPLRVEFLPGRMRFLKAGQTAIGPNERPPFGCCLAIWENAAYRPDHISGGLFGEATP